MSFLRILHGAIFTSKIFDTKPVTTAGSIVALISVVFFAGCGQPFQASSPELTASSPSPRMEKSVRQKTLGEVIQTHPKLARSFESLDPSSLLAEISAGELSNGFLFGGVVTALDVPNVEEIGDLKAAEYQASLAKIRFDQNQQRLVIAVCETPCDGGKKYVDAFWATAVQMENGNLLVDFSEFDLSLKIPMISEVAKKTAARVSLVGTSADTLVVEITTDHAFTDMTFVNKSPKGVMQTKTRWYLKRTSGFDPLFISRSPTAGVGFFPTYFPEEIFDNPSITRFSVKEPIHFYIKNVPSLFRQAFADSLEDWNQKLLPTLKKKILTYEFLEREDPRWAEIVAGDVRYNVTEWDTENVASYGGLGPAFSHPLTGQTFAAAVFVQGPVIEKTYREWFELAKNIQRGGPSVHLAEARYRDFFRALPPEPKRHHLGANLSRSARAEKTFLIHAHRKELQDPKFMKNDLDLPPSGWSFEKYMYGYFRDTVAHEVGHTLGLRHNFRGNLGSESPQAQGKVSWSIMEYLGRTDRHLNEVGPYDIMAIGYGYLGLKPSQLKWYCSDENEFQVDYPDTSAECSSNDSTNDPYSFFESRLEQVYQLVVKPQDTKASVWNAFDVQTPFQIALDGVASYITSAQSTGQLWTNFFGKFDRPIAKAEVGAYVSKRLENFLCSSRVHTDVLNKTAGPERDATRKQLKDLGLQVRESLEKYQPQAGPFIKNWWTCLDVKAE